MSRFIVFQMGLIFRFDDIEKVQPRDEITFSSLDFNADQLGNLRQKDLEPPG